MISSSITVGSTLPEDSSKAFLWFDSPSKYCIPGEHLGSHAHMILVVRFESREKKANNEFRSGISCAISAHPPSIINCQSIFAIGKFPTRTTNLILAQALVTGK